jgi:hypothetical protein
LLGDVTQRYRIEPAIPNQLFRCVKDQLLGFIGICACLGWFGDGFTLGMRPELMYRLGR